MFTGVCSISLIHSAVEKSLASALKFPLDWHLQIIFIIESNVCFQVLILLDVSTTYHSWSHIIPDTLFSLYLTVFWESESVSCSVVSNSLRPHGLYSPWNSLGQNTGVGSLSLLQGIFLTQVSNLGLLHYRQILYQLSHVGSPIENSS